MTFNIDPAVDAIPGKYVASTDMYDLKSFYFFFIKSIVIKSNWPTIAIKFRQTQ